MPGIYLPTITNYPNGVVSIRTHDDTSYKQIQASMGFTIYKIDWLYLKATSNEQLTVPVAYQKYDADGNIQVFVESATIDPYQLQTSLKIDMKANNLVFDGTLFLNLPLLPLETCYMYFYVTQYSATEILPKETMFTLNDFFDNFYKSIGYEL